MINKGEETKPNKMLFDWRAKRLTDVIMLAIIKRRDCNAKVCQW